MLFKIFNVYNVYILKMYTLVTTVKSSWLLVIYGIRHKDTTILPTNSNSNVIFCRLTGALFTHEEEHLTFTT